MISIACHRSAVLGVMLGVLSVVYHVPPSQAQPQCKSISECVQQAVDASARAEADVNDLKSRVAKLEEVVAVAKSRVLAIAVVKDGKFFYGSPGVTFDKGTGLITFPNPKSLAIVPVISDTWGGPFITETHWIKDIMPPNEIIVRRKSLDTGKRTDPPQNFTLMIFGFELP